MTEIQSRLQQLSDSEYAVFQAKLCPTVEKGKILGVRVPVLRKFAGKFSKEEESTSFLAALPHDYYDENLLHGFLISMIPDFKKCFSETEKFLPFVDNWAVCDTMSPKIFKKHKPELLAGIRVWIKSSRTYTIRFAVNMLMTHFLDDDFTDEVLELAASVKSEEYYVKMGIAWFFATALAKQWPSAVKFIETGRLEKWTHNKTIQKSVESFRISDEHKTYLRTMKKK